MLVLLPFLLYFDSKNEESFDLNTGSIRISPAVSVRYPGIISKIPPRSEYMLEAYSE